MIILSALALAVPLCLGACAQITQQPAALNTVTDEQARPQRPAAAWLAEGAQALAQGHPAEALPALLRFQKLAPNNATGAFLVGVARLDLEQPERARDALERAVVLDPSDIAALSLLARVSFELADGERGLELLEQVLVLDPQDAASQTALGLAYFQMGQLEPAYRALVAAVESDPQRVAAHVGLGRLLSLVGDPEQAALSYRTALQLSGDEVDPALHVSMGHVMRDLDRPDEALVSYLKAREGAPADPWIAANVASTLHELGRHREAREPIEWAVSQLSGRGIDMALVHLHHGLILEALGDLDGAVEALSAAVDAEPGLGRAQRALGEMLFDLGRFRAARARLAQGLEHDVLTDQLILELALLHERFGDRDGVLSCAEILREAADDHPRASLALAELRLRSRQSGLQDALAAEQDLRALSAGPLISDAHAWTLLGTALARRGALEEAADALDRGLALVGNEGPAGRRYRHQRARLLQGADDP